MNWNTYAFSKDVEKVENEVFAKIAEIRTATGSTAETAILQLQEEFEEKLITAEAIMRKLYDLAGLLNDEGELPPNVREL